MNLQGRLSRPAVSKHLRLLEGAGLVRFRSEGTRNLYQLDPDALAALRDEIDTLWRTALARFALDANNRKRQPPRGPTRPVPKKPPTGRAR